MKSSPLLMKGPLVRRTMAGEKAETRRLVTSLTGIGQLSEVRRSATPGYAWSLRDRAGRVHDLRHADMIARCPYGQPGDELWVRETWAPGDRLIQPHESDPPEYVVYRADNSLRRVTADAAPSADMRDGATPPVGAWRPAIFMPRDACRLRVRIVSVDIEPLQCITDADARAEGVATLTFGELIEMGTTPARIVRALREMGCTSLEDRQVLGTMRSEPTVLSGSEPRRAFQLVWDLINGERPGARWADDPYVWVIRYEVVR